MQPKRKSQRKHDYDYSQPGYYAVTVCTQNRSCLFGVIDNAGMLFNEAGRMIAKTWNEIPVYYPGIALDVMQIMPNHLHGIIVVCEVGTDPRVCPNPGTENSSFPGVNLAAIAAYKTIQEDGQTRGSVPTGCLSLPKVTKQFKTMTTKRYIDGVRNHGWYSFSGKLWQRSYHDRIIRNETELNKYRTYICNNPNNWDTDENNIKIQDRTCPSSQTPLTRRC